jgi:hypothetical protein
MMNKLLLVTLALLSSSAVAHPGHLADDSVHGLLHIEHIILLVVAAGIVFTINAFRNR